MKPVTTQRVGNMSVTAFVTGNDDDGCEYHYVYFRSDTNSLMTDADIDDALTLRRTIREFMSDGPFVLWEDDE
jgi:hypothetical protein